VGEKKGSMKKRGDAMEGRGGKAAHNMGSRTIKEAPSLLLKIYKGGER